MSTLRRSWERLPHHLNFYRIHLLVFTFGPLLFAIVFWASQSKNHKVSFLDSLFVCVSSMTVTGLATIDLSPLTGWQQSLLFIQMSIGNPIFVSWVVVYVRKSFLRKKYGAVMGQRIRERAEREGQDLQVHIRTDPRPWHVRLKDAIRRKNVVVLSRHTTPQSGDTGSGSERRQTTSHSNRLRPDMIRRMDKAPQLINPSGWISQGQTTPVRPTSLDRSNTEPNTKQLVFSLGDGLTASPEALEDPLPSKSAADPALLRQPGLTRRPSAQPVGSTTAVEYARSNGNHLSRLPTLPNTHPENHTNLLEARTLTQHDHEHFFPRTATVEFAPTRHALHHGRKGSIAELTESPTITSAVRRRSRSRSEADRRPPMSRGPGFPPTFTMNTTYTMHTARTRNTIRTQDQGFGGFPMPHQIVGRLVQKAFPNIGQSLHRTVTIPRTATLTSQAVGGPTSPGARPVPYISFDAVVGKNSVFLDLSEENMEELGGVEYRALGMLLWIIAAYHFGIQLICFAVLAPYLYQPQWREVLDSQVGYVPSTWFTAFQVVSSYTNTGTSLCDASMIPFQTAYPLIFVQFFLIVAGNTGYPIFLRFMIWVLTKLVPSSSRTNETLHFLLDHPRRCYLYLFQSHHTWFLLTILVMMMLTDWVAFLVLDIGTPELEAIPLGTRFAIGLLQAVAVRAAGFSTLALSALAPAVKVLYVTMMYVAVYPIALSVRSTNVYEEQSLGIFEDEDRDAEPDPSGPRGKVWGSYLAWHARKQLAFDMWWLGFALWLVCIIERKHITGSETSSWFTIFNIIFEIVSAYGTVGLSLGIPTANYSFAGAFRSLSKFIIILVMIRGRHRGLPVAIDRAVLIPDDQLDQGTAWRSPSIHEDDASGTRGRSIHGHGVSMEKTPTMPEHHPSHFPTNVDISSPANDKSRLDTVPEVTSPTVATHVEREKRHVESEDSSTAGSASSVH